MGLHFRRKNKKRLPVRVMEPLLQPIRPNVTWSMDFMSDTLSNGVALETFIQKGYRRLITQCTMRPLIVAHPHPCVCYCLCITQSAKLIPIQHLFSKTSVEPLYVSVLIRLALFNELDSQCLFPAPNQPKPAL